MSLILALNLVWVLFGCAVLALSVRAESARRSSTGRWVRLGAVLLVVLALFPCISASDDELNLSALSKARHSSSLGDTASQHLLRALQSLEHLQISVAFAFAIVMAFAGLVVSETYRSRTLRLAIRAVRGPPPASI